jgi:hypothetical protein
MSFANDTMLRTPEPGFLATADGNYAARAATSFGLACLYVAVDAALKGSTTPATIDLGPNNERLEDAKPHLVCALRELVRQAANNRFLYRTCPVTRRDIKGRPSWSRFGMFGLKPTTKRSALNG